MQLEKYKMLSDNINIVFKYLYFGRVLNGYIKYQK
ncbi:hypothetical protein Xish_01770 [Xenorhabdus ishibashii]|uniref:Uncharacterized protein n=1 Tax=Xenorhabdus ishibashii TaxID=1034471 RepID=A0A2D0KGK4_9GAMM|nr:hypothetical protein Xish_01770 [Xenorhabdus ishibashii]